MNHFSFSQSLHHPAMLPPRRSTRTSLSHSKDAEGGNSDDTSELSETPTPRRTIKSQRAQLKQAMEQKKARRKLTTSQKQALEALAERDVNPSLEDRRALAEEIGL